MYQIYSSIPVNKSWMLIFVSYWMFSVCSRNNGTASLLHYCTFACVVSLKLCTVSSAVFQLLHCSWPLWVRVAQDWTQPSHPIVSQAAADWHLRGHAPAQPHLSDYTCQWLVSPPGDSENRKTNSLRNKPEELLIKKSHCSTQEALVLFSNTHHMLLTISCLCNNCNIFHGAEVEISRPFNW